MTADTRTQATMQAAWGISGMEWWTGLECVRKFHLVVITLLTAPPNKDHLFIMTTVILMLSCMYDWPIIVNLIPTTTRQGLIYILR